MFVDTYKYTLYKLCNNSYISCYIYLLYINYESENISRHTTFIREYRILQIYQLGIYWISRFCSTLIHTTLCPSKMMFACPNSGFICHPLPSLWVWPP